MKIHERVRVQTKETPDASEQMEISLKKLVHHLEQNGFSDPLALVAEKEFHYKRGGLISSYWHLPTRTFNMSRLARTNTKLGEHMRRHEATHGVSRGKNIHSESGEDSHFFGKSGIRYWNEKYNIDDETQSALSLFVSLNEAITEYIAIQSQTGSDASFDDMQRWARSHFNFFYRDDKDLFQQMIESVSEATNTAPEKIFSLFVESYLVHWSPILKRKLLATFGPNALRVLAVLAPTGADGARSTKTYRLEAQVFFDIGYTFDRRQSAAKKILDGTPIRFVSKKTNI